MGRTLARIAGRQHGLVTRRQLIAAGFASSAIQRGLDHGSLLAEFPGVYRVGHRAPSLEARYLAAVLGCGDGAVLYGRAAGYLFKLLKGAAGAPEVLTRTERRLRGIATCRARTIDPRDVTIYRGIPVTTVARTLVDLAGVLELDALARAVHEADVRHATTPAQIEAVLARRPRSAGAADLRRVIQGDTPLLLSRLERRFRALLHADGLPLPQTNRPAGAQRVDCRWPDHDLTVELDSYRYHHTRHSWQQDHQRDREARARGEQIRRYSWTDLDNPKPLLKELRALLATDTPTHHPHQPP
jgi:hypothetical protein